MKVMVAGIVDKPSQSGFQRMTAMTQVGHDVVGVSTTAIQTEERILAYSRRFMPVGAYELLLTPKANRLHQLLIERAEAIKPDLIWLEWPRMISKKTVIELKKRHPNAMIVSFQDDNPFGTRRFASYGWHRFFDAMPHYDLHFVKRQSDVERYGALGAKNIEILLGGFSEEIFYPETVERTADSPDVVFIGTALDTRIPFLDKLTGELGVEVHIYGGRWDRTPLNADRKHLIHGPLWDADYRRVCCEAKIALGFVSHSNLDDYTMRVFEVPACGTMFLGEGTAFQKTLFEEDKEVVFFDTEEECRDKINYYLSHDEERKAVAKAGHLRGLSYGCRDMVRNAIAIIDSKR